MPSTPSQPWYVELFGPLYLATYSDRLDPERNQIETDFIYKTLLLREGSRVLDAPCGHGRHLLELAARGCEMTGVDLNQHAIDVCRARAKEQKVEKQVRLRHGDMRETPYVEEFDAAYNYFTSFGYLEDEAEDERALHAVACALKSGGLFLLETINIYRLAQIFRSKDDWQTFSTGYSMYAERSWNPITGRLDELRRIRTPNGEEREFSASLRLYSPTELRTMFEHVGLSVESVLSAPDGQPCSLESNRLAMVGKKTG